MRSLTLFGLFLTFWGTISAQYAISDAPLDLWLGSDAMIRLDHTEIDFHDFDDMTYEKKKVITVFNEQGNKVVRPVFVHDQYDDVQDYEVIIYDKSGNEVKTFKKRDFVEVSASGSSMYSDDRMIYLDFTPVFYPYTFEFNLKIRTRNTAFIPSFSPVTHTDLNIEKASYVVHNPKNIPLRIRKLNLDHEGIKLEESPTSITVEISRFMAVDKEPLSPPSREFLPSLTLFPEQFRLQNQEGNFTNWTEFGAWLQTRLLNGRDEIPESTKMELTSLVQSVEDPREKARLIYEYVQGKTRYVSIQIGIGGWQPTPAEEVDRLRYGDCKGLVNYTQSLLKLHGIDSYYTLVDSQIDGRDLDEDFVAFQGDHAILSVPFEEEMVFLECTSQDSPFNYLGTHTDDRKVLMITPEGGKMIRTHAYSPEDNLTTKKVQATLKSDLSLLGTIEIDSQGLAYGRASGIPKVESDKMDLLYGRRWDHLNGLGVNNLSFKEQKNEVKFSEELDFMTSGYGSTAGDRILLNPNVLTRSSNPYEKMETRERPVEIRRGFSYSDEVVISLPSNVKIHWLFEDLLLDTEFGIYEAKVKQLDHQTVQYSRKLLLKNGTFTADKYNNYVEFRDQIEKFDRSKILLTKTD